MAVDVRYCTTEDGVQIAYSRVGEGPPLVRVLGWFTHLEYELKTNMWGGYRDVFGRRYTSVVYDGRGTGLSDRNIERFTRQGFLDDLDAVINATGFEQVALFAISQGGSVAIKYALESPERVSHLEYELKTNMWGGYRDVFGRRYTSVVYDGRGTGLSDRNIERFMRQGFLDDLDAVINATGFEQVALFGISQGGAVAIKYALENPERVSHLALYGTFARPFGDPEQARTRFSLIKQGWGSDLPAHRQFFTSLFMPDNATAADIAAFNELQRVSADAETAAALFSINGAEPGLFERLKEVKVPTVVLHQRGDAIVPFEEGRAIASSIPGARFVPLEGSNHALTASEAGVWETMADAVDQLIQPDAAPRRAGEPSSFRTVLFTDIVGHTEMMSRLGDEAGRDVLREHERITRDVLKANGGTEVKTMGDGFMASFGSVTKAVECAIAFQKAFEERNSSAQEPLSVRVGLNAGEPIEEDGDLFGATVILAARIAAKADGGEILVSDVIRGLCSGKGFLFADRGDFVAKGFEEPVHLFEISWHG